MYKIINEIYNLISKNDKFKFKILIVLVFLMSFFEIIGLALILPFLFLVSNLNIAITNEYINSIYTYFDFHDTFSFLIAVGVLAITFSLLGVILSIYTNLKMTKVSNDIGADFSVRILKFSIDNVDTDKSTEAYKNNRKKILTDTAVVSNKIILPIIMIVSKTILIAVFFTGLMIVNYKVTLLFLFVLIITYVPIFYLTNMKRKRNMKRIEILKEERNVLVYDILNNKNNILQNRKKEALKEYFNQTYELSRHQSLNNVVSRLPRYLIMFLVLTSIVGISIYLTYVSNGDMDAIIHKMFIFIVVGLKTLPQIQNVFINYLSVKSNIKSFENIRICLI